MESAPAWVANLPTINAAFNATSALLLLLGYRFIRARRIDRHRACMVAAFTASCLFLVGYLTLHYHIGGTLFGHEGEWIRTLYFAVLLSHTVLAPAVAVMAVLTLRLGLKGKFDSHRRLARWTLPMWLYVSVTGVIIYVMLYHVPGAAG